MKITSSLSEEAVPSNDELKDANSFNGNVKCGLMFESDEIVEEEMSARPVSEEESSPFIAALKLTACMPESNGSVDPRFIKQRTIHTGGKREIFSENNIVHV